MKVLNQVVFFCLFLSDVCTVLFVFFTPSPPNMYLVCCLFVAYILTVYSCPSPPTPDTRTCKPYLRSSSSDCGRSVSSFFRALHELIVKKKQQNETKKKKSHRSVFGTATFSQFAGFTLRILFHTLFAYSVTWSDFSCVFKSRVVMADLRRDRFVWTRHECFGFFFPATSFHFSPGGKTEK